MAELPAAVSTRASHLRWVFETSPVPVGSIPFGYLIVRLTAGADVRETGSGGTGATNVSRRAGKIAGVQTNDLRLTDRRTHSTWSGLTGRCLEGPSKGAQLRQLTSTQFVVENWPLHYPKAAVYRMP